MGVVSEWKKPWNLSPSIVQQRNRNVNCLQYNSISSSDRGFQHKWQQYLAIQTRASNKPAQSNPIEATANTSIMQSPNYEIETISPSTKQSTNPYTSTAQNTNCKRIPTAQLQRHVSQSKSIKRCFVNTRLKASCNSASTSVRNRNHQPFNTAEHQPTRTSNMHNTCCKRMQPQPYI